jgi:hypothetical protein
MLNTNMQAYGFQLTKLKPISDAQYAIRDVLSAERIRGGIEASRQKFRIKIN